MSSTVLPFQESNLEWLNTTPYKHCESDSSTLQISTESQQPQELLEKEHGSIDAHFCLPNDVSQYVRLNHENAKLLMPSQVEMSGKSLISNNYYPLQDQSSESFQTLCNESP
jgi:hypothetical protein